MYTFCVRAGACVQGPTAAGGPVPALKNSGEGGVWAPKMAALTLAGQNGVAKSAAKPGALWGTHRNHALWLDTPAVRGILVRMTTPLTPDRVRTEVHITPVGHRDPFRVPLLWWFSAARTQCTPAEAADAMTGAGIPHVSDLCIRTVIARPLHGCHADGTPWPADTHGVVVSTVRVPSTVARSAAPYETMVFRITGIDQGDPVLDYSTELYHYRYHTAGDAFLGHSDTVGLWSGTTVTGATDALNLLP